MPDEKSLLEIAIIPILVGLIGFAGALIAAFWGGLQAWSRGRVFEKLILRELEEISPHPSKRNDKKKWTQHLTEKEFIHQPIFVNSEQNRDFILGLNPDLVYFVKQLWVTIGKEKCQVTPDADQFHHFLDEIVCYADKRPWRKLKIFKKYSRVTELKDMHK